MTVISKKETYTGPDGELVLCQGTLVLSQLPHGNFPVPESKLYYCEFTEKFHNGQYDDNGDGIKVQQDCCYAITPMIISNDEKIFEEAGDEIACLHTKEASKYINVHTDYQRASSHDCCKKILAKSEQLPDKVFTDIIAGKLKDGDAIQLECSNVQNDFWFNGSKVTFKNTVINLENDKVKIWKTDLKPVFNYRCHKCGSSYINLEKPLSYSTCVVSKPITQESCGGKLVSF